MPKYDKHSFCPTFLKDIKAVLDKHEPNKNDIVWDGGELMSLWNQVDEIYQENKDDDSL